MERRWWAPLGRFQLEDVAVVVIVVVTPFVDAIYRLLPVLGDRTDFLGGLISFLAAVGAVVALLTRVAGESRLDHRPGERATEGAWMIGPFVLAVAFVCGDSLDRMGLPGGDLLIGVAFVAVVLSVLFANRLPAVSRNLRRLLMTPFVLLSAAFFVELASGVARSFGGGTVDALLALNNLMLLVQLLILLALAAVPFYLALIFVPRELADPGGDVRSWAIRFVVFYVSLVVAIALGGGSPVIAA